MRGKPSGRPCAHGIGRITPAYAGKTDGVAHDIGKWEDHPRVCGENPLMKRQRDFRTGSPPRMRGKPADEAAKGLPNRITPADAGKTVQPCERLARIKDHPRGCGENMKFSRAQSRIGGSPPRMRGKHMIDMPVSAEDRITPADAGKTVSPLPNLSPL